jgi:hypothetical protein
MANADWVLVAFPAFMFVAALTWFFSSRPRLFLRTFAPSEELRFATIRHMLRDPSWPRAMRFIALLQIAMAFVVGAIGFWLRFL